VEERQLRVAGLHRLAHDLVGGRPRDPVAQGELQHRPAAHRVLEGHRSPADGHVADLAGTAGRPLVQAAAELDRETEPSGNPQQREGVHVLGAATGALTDRRQVGVVLDRQRRAHGPSQVVHHPVDLPPRDVTGVDDAVGPGVVRAGEPEDDMLQQLAGRPRPSHGGAQHLVDDGYGALAVGEIDIDGRLAEHPARQVGHGRRDAVLLSVDTRDVREVEIDGVQLRARPTGAAGGAARHDQPVADQAGQRLGRCRFGHAGELDQLRPRQCAMLEHQLERRAVVHGPDDARSSCPLRGHGDSYCKDCFLLR